MLRVLCLHGSRQTSEIFENQLSKLCSALADVAVFEFMDAPVILPLINENDDVHTRSWCDSSQGALGDYTSGDYALQTRIQEGAYDVLLGFSQGALVAIRYIMMQRLQSRGMGTLCGLSELPPVKGVVLAGTPSPQRCLEGTTLLQAYLQGIPEVPTAFLGELPSLHIVGRKDSIVLPEESMAFAADCGEVAELVLHEHAHSIPQLQSVIGALHDFFLSLTLNPTELKLMQDTQSEELMMVASMYGEECVRHKGSPSGAIVELPLLPDLDVDDDVVVSTTIRSLRLRYQIPRLYPAVLPGVDITGEARSHNTDLEMWKAELALRTLSHLREDVGAGGAMLLPGLLFATSYTQEHMPFLKAMLQRSHGAKGGDVANDDVADGLSSLWLQEAENDVVRRQNIESSERASAELLKRICQGERGSVVDSDHGEGWVAESVCAFLPRQGGGSWTLTVGLIGKPSAGKSTFFNSVTDPESESQAARVAAFPFTTIEPNVGAGFGAVRCPCSVLLQNPSIPHKGGSRQPLCVGLESCNAAYGHATVNGSAHYRRHPILVKDVAGLVQGAYQGKGKGNQFLNDLCDADVLVHVVDGAGATDAGGVACQPGQGSTLDDIVWVRAEVHCWIYDNISAKWTSIRRQPQKLLTMFSGYRSSPAFVLAILHYLDIPNETALRVTVPHWGPKELHLLVALYIRLRFPVVVALNKSDLPAAAGYLAKLRQLYPEEVFIPMSAKTECDLLCLRKKGIVQYLSGELYCKDVSTVPLSPDDARKLSAAESFLQRCRENVRESPCYHGRATVSLLTSTGVQDVIAASLERCGAVFVFPVGSFYPSVPTLEHCFAFKRGATVENVFHSLANANLLDGKLVRFEAVDAQHSEEGVVTLKKTDTIPATMVLARVLTNKRQMAS